MKHRRNFLSSPAAVRPWLGGGAGLRSRTEPEMFDALLAFLRTNCDAKITASPTELAEGAQSKAVVVDGNTLRIGYRAEDKTTNLYADTASGTRPDADYALVEKIGRRFNEKLKQGSHQDLFTTY